MDTLDTVRGTGSPITMSAAVVYPQQFAVDRVPAVQMDILLVGADDARAALLACHVRTLWPAARIARAAADGGGDALALVARPDLMILNLAATGGLAACRRLRAACPDAPLLALGTHNDGADEVAALDAGADFYLPDSADPLLLLARLRALGRRVDRTPVAMPPPAAGLIVDAARREARLDGAALDLTPTEYVLLAALAVDRGRIVAHRTLLARVWGQAHLGDTHYLKAYINRLRAKLGDDRGRPRHIQTCRGLGYRLHNAAAA
ncbi:MAG TPA: response regulator transcription factor [Thermomicrobiales bacterium]|jgi:two-component system KDP operon response regulator KdpE